jgi:hypothetical protein
MTSASLGLSSRRRFSGPDASYGDRIADAVQLANAGSRAVNSGSLPTQLRRCAAAPSRSLRTAGTSARPAARGPRPAASSPIQCAGCRNLKRGVLLQARLAGTHGASDGGPVDPGHAVRSSTTHLVVCLQESELPAVPGAADLQQTGARLPISCGTPVRGPGGCLGLRRVTADYEPSGMTAVVTTHQCLPIFRSRVNPSCS